jgi:hypothetical protein
MFYLLWYTSILVITNGLEHLTCNLPKENKIPFPDQLWASGWSDLVLEMLSWLTWW